MKKNNTIRKIAVVGDGGWGTTLAIVLAGKSLDVSIWGPFPAYLNEMNKSRVNSKFLPGIVLPKSIRFESNLTTAVSSADLIVFAIPSKFASAVIRSLKQTEIRFKDKAVLSVTKGIDTQSLLRISQIMIKELNPKFFGVLSGPTIASEVALGIPSTAVISSKNILFAEKLQGIFNTKTFRIYVNADIAGLEIGGSVKNVIAIACGVCDGLGFGTNTKAAIVTRGLAEMARLGKKMGANAETFCGLSGLGDLVTTCFSPKSRNRTVGEQLGKGKGIRSILSDMDMVAEGVETAKAVFKLSKKYKVEMPITEMVCKILYKNKKPKDAVNDLMRRKPKSE